MAKRYVLIVILLAACRKEAPLQTRAADMAAAPQEAAATASSQVQRLSSPPVPAAPRMIIRNASLSLVVRDALDVLGKASAFIESKGGYVAEQRQWKDREQVRASAVLRVPSQQLMPSLAALRGLAVRVENEAITGEDVSQEFSDLGAQLKNLQLTETELRELLRTVRERTQKASEIMEIYTEISKVRGDIERIQGRMQYLSQMAAMSTIRLDLVPDAIAAPVVEPGWQPVATVRAATRSLVNTIKGLADIAIWVLIYVLPIGLILIAVGLLIRSVWRRLRRA
jgi:hypothetical protein